MECTKIKGKKMICIPKSEFQERIIRIQAEMEKEKLAFGTDVAGITHISCSFDRSSEHIAGVTFKGSAVSVINIADKSCGFT